MQRTKGFEEVPYAAIFPEELTRVGLHKRRRFGLLYLLTDVIAAKAENQEKPLLQSGFPLELHPALRGGNDDVS